MMGGGPPEIFREFSFRNPMDDYDERGDATLVDGMKPLQCPPRFAIWFFRGHEAHDEADNLVALIRNPGLRFAR